MEREVFENLSIASLMNKSFINIKVDREEHPELDEIYMVARQLITQEGGWPNNVFLTPDLKPFYAGGTYAPDDSYGRPAFPRLIEWLNYAWTTQEASVRNTAEEITKAVKEYLTFKTPENATSDMRGQADKLFAMLKGYHDERSGGFFQAPKFPHESYLSFLLAYHEATGNMAALDIAAHSLGKMAAGGIYDHVGCGFHRYAVDKEWYVPHFEKMLYSQAQLARVYTDAARITDNAYFTDIAKSVLDFVSGPMTDGNGAFYAAIDAETDGVEGAYYAWTSQELEALLTPEETQFFIAFYALADIPSFPGHKHTEGQVIVARKPLAQAAIEQDMPYVQLAAMAGQIMNKLLVERNKRKAPNLDDKIIVSWNGMMIDAFAHAAYVFNEPRYVQIARKAADYILEHAIDNDGRLCRIVAGGKAQVPATLEDYAYLIKGLLSLWRAKPDEMLLEVAVSMFERAEELFGDPDAPGYFYTQDSQHLLMRFKNGDDSAIPSANAIMLDNLLALHDIKKDESYRDKAMALAGFFLDGTTRVLVEFAATLQGALKLNPIVRIGELPDKEGLPADEDTVKASLSLSKNELTVTLDIEEGWHINANKVSQPFLVATQLDVQGEGVELVEIIWPEPVKKPDALSGEVLPVYEGKVKIKARLKLADSGKKRPAVKALIRFQPCSRTLCHAVRDVTLTA
jgi:uncharacterized protein